MNNFETYIQKDFKLPSPPAIAIEILEAVKDKHADSDSLAGIISSDPALTARILKFANSPLYSSCVKIDSIDRAVTVLGTETLKNIALSFAIAQANNSMQGNGEESVLLGLADKISSAYHGSNTIDRVKEVHRAFQRHKTIGEEEIAAFIDQVGEQSIEMLSSFDIDAGSMKPYSQLLQEANDELGKLNLSYEQLIIELKQAKQKSDKLAEELKKTNDQLRLLALRDGLTSLYNHTYFQDALIKEISKAQRYKRILSLIILDLDHFKTVNDTYGHLIGDRVIKRVAAEIKGSIRDADIAARDGGEEFTVILPETGLEGAMQMGERLRNSIEELRLSNDSGIDFGVTVSAGVATYDPHKKRVITTVELIKEADRGLYLSKNQGRNRVSHSKSGGLKENEVRYARV